MHTISLNLNLDLFTLAHENLYVNTQKYGDAFTSEDTFCTSPQAGEFDQG